QRLQALCHHRPLQPNCRCGQRFPGPCGGCSIEFPASVLQYLEPGIGRAPSLRKGENRAPGFEPRASWHWPVRPQAPLRVGAQKVGERLTVRRHPCIESAKPRAVARCEAETAICARTCGFGDTEGGPRAAISRVLYPLRDGDHLSGAPVARRL